jgi:hypothetical protein
MQHGIYLPGHEDKVRDIMADKEKTLPPSQVSHVFWFTGNEVIYPNDLMAFVEQFFAQMGTEESRGSGDQYSHIISSPCNCYELYLPPIGGDVPLE